MFTQLKPYYSKDKLYALTILRWKGIAHYNGDDKSIKLFVILFSMHNSIQVENMLSAIIYNQLAELYWRLEKSQHFLQKLDLLITPDN